MVEPFFVKSCALAVISTGEFVMTLAHLKEVMKRIPLRSIYYHFWGSRLRASFTHPDYYNDFAYWAHSSLHDSILSERLGILDPTEFTDLEDLRKALIEVIDERLDEIEYSSWSKDEIQFQFLEASTIVFDTSIKVTHPKELKSVIPSLSFNSIFYHFIDARRRTPERIDDFCFWLKNFGNEYSELIKKIKSIDPFFSDLSTIRQRLEQTILKEVT